MDVDIDLAINDIDDENDEEVFNVFVYILICSIKYHLGSTVST